MIPAPALTISPQWMGAWLFQPHFPEDSARSFAYIEPPLVKLSSFWGFPQCKVSISNWRTTCNILHLLALVAVLSMLRLWKFNSIFGLLGDTIPARCNLYFP